MEGLSSSKQENQPWRVLEFYSGVGGMRYSLTKAGVHAQVVEAFDINDSANDVYEHNFGHRPFQGNIQSLTAADLDRYDAQAWLLSPPCQPYTRQGLQKHSGDARAFSFVKILELIPDTKRPPTMLFVENVVGFETSDTREKMIKILTETGFVMQEFILSPLQFGVPYSRPRYFCLAKRKPSSFQRQCFNNKILWSLSPSVEQDDDSLEPRDNWDKFLESCEPIEKFLEFSHSAVIKTEESNCPETGNVSSEGKDLEDQYLVPLSLTERWGSAMDIVYPDSRRCCCFTKSYYRYVKGTGSFLATVVNNLTVNPTDPKIKGKVCPLEEQRLRYFTPREVANLHSFPDSFNFPEHVSLRQRYALLGNSLSVAVVAPLLRHLFNEPTI